MIPSRVMGEQPQPKIVLIAGPTASGKSARAIEEALTRDGEIISVDSRQVYKTLDIGTEKITGEEMRGVPHYLIDIREPEEPYSAFDFVRDAQAQIHEIHTRGKLPILVGGTHFYFDALLKGLPETGDSDPTVTAELESLSTEKLFERIQQQDPRRAGELDRHNRRRLVRALEITHVVGTVPPRSLSLEHPQFRAIGRNGGWRGQAEWVVIDLPKEELRERIDGRLTKALERGLVEEVERTRGRVGDARLNELGLEYRVVGQFLRGEISRKDLLPTLSAKLWQYARRQKAWLRKLKNEVIEGVPLHPDRN